MTPTDLGRIEQGGHQVRSVTIGALRASVVGLGCNQFGATCDAADAAAVVSAALDSGIDFFDVADEYGPDGLAEEYLGRAIAGHRAEVTIATKFSSRLRNDPASGGASRKWIETAVEASLRRLGTDYIDLYQQHFPDPSVGQEETLAALHDLVTAGKVREIGVCNMAATDVRARLRHAAAAGYRPIASVQDRYNLLRQEAADELLPAVRASGVAFIPYFPLASGMLSGRYRRGQPPPSDTRFHRHVDPEQARHMIDRDADQVATLQEWAQDHHHSIADLAIAWLASQPGVGPVIAGVSTSEQVRANAQAADWELPEADIEMAGNLARVARGGVR
jgi:aryl-alcohol dehydrogenase-like predicted oxidoreductase